MNIEKFKPVRFTKKDEARYQELKAGLEQLESAFSATRRDSINRGESRVAALKNPEYFAAVQALKAWREAYSQEYAQLRKRRELREKQWNVSFSAEPQRNAMPPKNKEQVNRIQYVTTDAGKLACIIDARFYMGRSTRSSVVYCCVWISFGGRYISGAGQAGGYGYHKESAALAAALRSAGVTMAKWREGKTGQRCDISAVGESAMHDAMVNIAHALGAKGQAVIC